MSETKAARASILKSAESIGTGAGLACAVKIYVPGTNGVDKAADNAATVESAARLLSGAFGGCTAMPAAGFWVSDAVGLVREAVTIVYAFCTAGQLVENVDAVLSFCEKMRDDLKQEAVSLEVNNILYFI